MPSVKGFLEDLLKRIWTIHLGYNVKDALKLLIVAILQSVPRTIRKQFSFLDKKIEEIVRRFIRNTIVNIDDIIYTLVDPESLYIVSHEFESFMTMWLKPRRGEVFVDIGAHIGKYTLLVAKTLKNEGMVVAIEPNPLNYQALQRNIRLNELENVVALNLAAWNKNCELNLYFGEEGGRHSVKINRRLGWVKVKAMSIAHVLNELCISKAHWIKIDVEGAEFEVLQGLEENIKMHRPKIIIEVFYENVEKVKNFMRRCGYDLIRISPFFTEGFYFFCVPLS